MPLDTKWGFKKSPKSSESESPMMEMKEHSDQSMPMDKEKDNKDMGMERETKMEEGGASPSDAGLRPIDATCSDCRHLDESETKCSKVALPSNFSAYQMVCQKFFEPKESTSNVPPSDTSSPASAAPAPPTA
jgi:hypothetical protein